MNHAPCAGKLPLIFSKKLALIASALALKSQGSESGDVQQGIPEFEIADGTYVETRESKTSLEREMTLKAFTESGIHAAL